MWDYLGFPKKYQVDKRMDKERYLRHANLTPSEYRKLAAYLDNIKVLYDIPYKDGSEIVVLLLEISAESAEGRFRLINLTRAVTSSFPYPCLLVIRCEAIVKFFISEEYPNMQNAGRNVVSGQYASRNMLMDNDEYSTILFLQRMRQCISEAQNAERLHHLWLKAIIEQAGGWYWAKESAQMNFFGEILYNRNILLKRQRILEECTSADTAELPLESYYENQRTENVLCSDDYQDEECQMEDSEEAFSDIYEGYALDDNEPVERLFIEFCAKKCRLLYTQYHGNVESDQEWLIAYSYVCNEYAQLLFKKSLTSSAILQIKAFFLGNACSNDLEYNDDYDIDVLAEMLDQYFYQ